jgi:hypothetical protein
MPNSNLRTCGPGASARLKFFTAWLAAAGFLATPASATDTGTWASVQPILARNVSILNSPPTQTPGVNVTGNNLNIPDGPFMGNGGVTAAIGGTAASQTYTITTTDFWNASAPKVVGSVTINTPGFDAGASYQQAQDPGLAQVRSSFSEGIQQVQIRSLVAATSNLLLIQITNSGSATISGISIVTQAGSVGTNDSLPVTSGVQSLTGYVTRTTAVSGNPWVASVALATRVVDAASVTTSVVSGSAVESSFSVPSNTTVNIVVGVGGGHNSTTYLNDALNLANSQTDSSISTLYSAHLAWWQTFWLAGATVDLGGGPVEQYWYTSLYLLACSNRTGQEMPGMQAIQTEDDPLWGGTWTADYNIENTYLGVFSANHPELAAPYDAALNQYLSTAYSNAGNSSGSDGAFSEVAFGPGGQNQLDTTWGMNGDAAWLATVLVNQWNYTRNSTWASQTAYLWLLATAHWWDQHLVYENGYYNDINSAQNEGSSYSLNAMGDLSNLRALYAALIDMNESGAVTSAASDLALWKTELAGLAPLPTFTYNGHTDFKSTQDAPGFYGGDANPVNGAVWSPVLGLGSSATTLLTLQNTIYDLGDNASIWYQGNSFGWIYPAAARAGLPDIFSRLQASVAGRLGEPALMRANGTVSQNGGGAETAGSIETVNGMLLSSYDGTLRLFPAWPLARNASFSNMAAVGGFTVSSAVSGGIIQPTTIVSAVGRPLTVAQPWPGATITITDTASTANQVTGSTATVTASTIAGHSYSLTFGGANPPAPDLALLGAPIVSSDIGNTDWWAGYANDGQTTSQASTLGWSSSSKLTGDHTEYYELDLGTSMPFNEVDLWPRSDAGNAGQGFPSSYNVAVSNDGASWTVVATGSVSSAPTAHVVVALAAQNARYVRINGLHLTANANDSGAYRMQFAEVGIFNRATAAPSFSITPAAASLNVAQNASSSLAITITPLNGFTGTVSISSAGLPANVTGVFSASSSTSVTLTVTASASATPGQYPITLTGTSAGLTATASFSLNLTASTSAGGGSGSSTAAMRFVPVAPLRVVDTRNATGAFGGPSISAGTTRSFVIPTADSAIPSGALAYSLNVTVVPSGTLSSLTVYPTGATAPSFPLLSSDGRVKAQAAIVLAGTGGAITVAASNTTNVIIDVNGYFVPASNSAGLTFYPITPARLFDTRNGSALAAGQVQTFAIQSMAGIPATAQAYSLNLTVVPTGTLGDIIAWPAGQAQPATSTLNTATNVTANAAIVGAGTSGSISVVSTGPTNLLIDINGYWAPPGTGGLSLYPVTPVRLYNSGATDVSGAVTLPAPASSTGIPATAQALLLDATVTPPAAFGHLILWPGATPMPNVSTLNANDGSVTSNTAVVGTTTGSINFFALNPTVLTLDAYGYFAP